ncbi:MAG TPA: hypothetical protein EYN06_06720 [Myxococcales bacterium]|nr:hypothetical protein [Myxococcales bacterium]HIN86156.1 hypothetical protein [Myxococcales bacterium]
MSGKKLTEFKRINFFRGFMTTEDDWNDAEQYHVEKRKLHNRIMHTPGVVPHYQGGFRVSARGKGELSVEIAPGYSVDGQGNDIILPEAEIKPINPGDFKLPNTIYVVAKYIEEFTDFIAYKENLEYKGHRRIAERCRIDVEVTEPDIYKEIELCRIYLEPGVRRITEPRDPMNPRANEIDRRFVPIAGPFGSNLSPKMTLEILELMSLARITYGYLFHDLRILTASAILNSFLTLDMMTRANMLALSHTVESMSLLMELEWQMVQDIDANHPQFASRKEFAAYKKNIEIARGMSRDGSTLDYLINCVGYQSKSCEALQELFSHKLESVPQIDSGAPMDKVFESIKVRSGKFTKSLAVDGQKFKLIDLVDLIDNKNEEDHKFKISQERDRYRTRQKLKYPDGNTVEDVGVAYEGGYAEWEITGCTPKKDVIMITRMDYVHGEYETEMYVNGKKVGNSVCPGNDRRFRWRNWPFVIPGEYVDEPTLKIKQVPITAGRDVNMFKIWFYHPA